jgi:hypothetical protein
MAYEVTWFDDGRSELLTDEYVADAMQAVAGDWEWGGQQSWLLLTFQWQEEMIGFARYKSGTLDPLDPMRGFSDAEAPAVMLAVEGASFASHRDPVQVLVVAALLADGTWVEAHQQQGEEFLFWPPAEVTEPVYKALMQLLDRSHSLGLVADDGTLVTRAVKHPYWMIPKVSMDTVAGTDAHKLFLATLKPDHEVASLGVFLAEDSFGEQYTLLTDDLELHAATRERVNGSGLSWVNASTYCWRVHGWPPTVDPSAPDESDRVGSLLRAQGAHRQTLKGRKLPLGENGAFVDYTDVVAHGSVLWAVGAAPDPTAIETSDEDSHQLVFRLPDGTGYYLDCSEGFVETVWLGVGRPDETFVAMGKWLLKHPDELNHPGF